MSTTFHLAVCQDCEPVLPQPFSDEHERDHWAGAHARATGHLVELRTEVRP
jgi:hypothetical protein